MDVKLIDLKERYKEEKNELINCFKKTVSKGNLILTKEVLDFEDKIKKFINVNFCLGLNSGTDALMMALWVKGIKRGDEIITTPKSFVATVGAIDHVGAKPVFADISDDLNIDPKKIEEKITKKTKAILPVHWTGRICKMDIINKIAKKYKLIIIEDASQAMGSYYKNKHSGQFGNIATFSAHPLKNLNALGDGGYLVTNIKKEFEKIKLFRNHGMISRDKVKFFGVNSRLDSLNAAVLSYRLKKLESVIKKRRANVALYKTYLDSLGIGEENIILPKEESYERNSYVMFINLCRSRDKLQKYLNAYGIQTLVYYGTPLHLHPASKKFNYKKGDFPVAEKACSKVLAFPHHQHLKKNQILYVCEKIRDFYKKN